MRLLPAALAALLCLAAQDQDVIKLKNGTTRSGRIASESDKEIVLETFIKGSKGEILGSGKVTIQKSDIDSVQRAGEDASRKAAERSRAFGERGLRRVEMLSRIQPEACDVEGAKGMRVNGSTFVLESTCEAAFVKEMAFYLDEIFGAYRKHFGVRRNADRRLKVFVFSDREEYERFQRRKYGGAVLNPAHYNSKDNFIAAFNMIQKAEERRVRTEIRDAERMLEGLKTQVASESDRINRQAREIRQKIVDAAAKARRDIRAANPPDREKLLKEVDQWEKDKQGELKTQEAELQKELDTIKKAADKDIQANRKVVDQNEKVLLNQNHLMLEMLFHEGFHAYATNHLWEGSEKKEFPRWLHEGMASYFEMSVVEGGDLIYGAPHPAFVRILKEKRLRGGLALLDDILRGGAEMFMLTHPSEAERSTVNYAQSWLMARYIAEKATREQIEAYVNEVLAGGSSVKAFETLAGKSVRSVEQDLSVLIESFK
jgi:hypothetical protein